MALPPLNARKPRRRWRWHVPPALTHGGESLEGTEVLDEFSGAAGMVLWQSMRDATLWAMTAEEERAGLFPVGSYPRRLSQLGEAGLDAAADTPLRSLAEMCRAPEAMSEEAVLAACRDVATWAESRGRTGTAIAFAQAGALAAPANAAAGCRVGKLTRNRGENARAESWFRRVIGLGRQAKDWASYAEAFVGLGELAFERGGHAAARRLHTRGLRAARRHGLRDIQGRALHQLFAIAAEGAQPDAVELARAAARAYGPRHPRLAVLARDLSSYWLLQGNAAPALQLLQGLAAHFVAPAERVRVLSDTGRAAGAAGDRQAFDSAWDEVWGSAGEWQTGPGAAPAMLELARGAATLRDWGRAERAATTAREIAARREEARVVSDTDALLDAIARKRAPDAPAESASEESLVLAGELSRALRRSAPRH